MWYSTINIVVRIPRSIHIRASVVCCIRICPIRRYRIRRRIGVRICIRIITRMRVRSITRRITRTRIVASLL